MQRTHEDLARSVPSEPAAEAARWLERRLAWERRLRKLRGGYEVTHLLPAPQEPEPLRRAG